MLRKIVASRSVLLATALAACGPSTGESATLGATSEQGASSSTGVDSASAGAVTGANSTSGTSGPSTTSSTTADATSSPMETTADTVPDTDDCDFICETSGPTEEPWACSPSENDCPPRDGQPQKCVFYVPQNGSLRREGTRCIPVTGDKGPYEPCSLPTGIGPEISDDCDGSGYCLEVYGTADHGFCAPYCEPGFGCDAYPGASHSQENGSSFPEACLYGDCDPADPQACPEDMRCVFYPAWLYDATQCWKVPEGGLELGASCDYGQCAPGLLCVRDDYANGCQSERCCVEWCDKQSPSCADPGSSCEGTWAGVNADLGACVIPGSTE